MTGELKQPFTDPSPSKLPLLVLVTIAGWFPILGVLMSSAIAHLGGCQVYEDGPRQCLVLGVDLGGLALSLGMTGFYFIFTWPVAILSLVLWWRYHPEQ